MVDFSQVQILHENPVYRMSDIVLGRGPRHKMDRQTILSNPMYDETILRDYLTRLPSDVDCDTILFADVVRRHMWKYKKARPQDLVMHVRLGDVMHPDLAETEQEIRCKSIYQVYVQLFDKYGQWIRSHKQVTIVTALHFGANDLTGKYFYTKEAEQNSFELLRRLCNTFAAWGLGVSLQSSRNVDEDFCFMASSKRFLGSTSLFANLVSLCLEDDAQCHLM